MTSYLLSGGIGDVSPMGSLSSPTFQPTGRGGVKEFFFGTPESYIKIPGREALFQQLLGGPQQGLPMSFDFLTRLLQGDQSIFQELEAPALRQFEQQIVPGLAERFTAMGSGGQSSSAYQQQLAAAGSRLAQDLAGQRAGYRMSALDRLLSSAGSALSAQPYQVVPRTSGFFEQLPSAIASGFGAFSRK